MRVWPAIHLALTVALLLTVVIGGVMLSHRQAELERRLLLARVTMPGRTADQVREWMGPGRLDESRTIPGIGEVAVLVYGSTGPGSLQRSEDVWVALDERDRVITVYYPDYPTERRIVTAGAAPESPGE